MTKKARPGSRKVDVFRRLLANLVDKEIGMDVS